MKWSALGAGGRVLVGAGVAGVIGVSGYLINQSATAPVPEATLAAVPDVAPAPVEQAAPKAEPTTQVALPSFDLVRIDPQGNTTVAGSAQPAQALSIRLDGAEIAQAVADAQGKFAALFAMDPNPNPRLLTLVAIGSAGKEVMAENSVAISPFAGPETAGVAVTPAEAPVALVLSPNGVEAIVNETAMAEPADAAAPRAVSISAITYSPSGGVILSGSGSAEAPLRLYLDQSAVAETAVQADGNWSVELLDVAPGIYTLRVDQLNAEGQVDARFETPFKRETQQALAAATAAEEPAAQVSTEAVVVAKADETAKPVPAEPVSAEPALAEPALDAANLPETQATPTDAAKTTEVTPEVAAPTVAEATPSVAAVVEETATPEVAAAPAPPVTITVQPGFTLWRIAQDQLGQGIMYVQVFEANQGKITDPDLIYPGQIFTIPKLAD